MDSYQATKEVAGAIFYALLSLYDDAAERESVELLTDMLETGAVRDPAARSILRSIVRSSSQSQREAA
jgi:hypothetical protein